MVQAGCTYLDGIGYREQELQQAKGTIFESETPNGIAYASMNGGTHIFIKSPCLTENPSSNVIVLFSRELNVEFTAPLLTADDQFNSNPALMTLAYRLPSPHELMRVNQHLLDEFSVMNFDLTVKIVDEHGETQTMGCTSSQKCLVKYKRAYTPVLFYISPPVVYQGVETDFVFNPRHIKGLLKDLDTDELPFINAKIGGALVNFDDHVDETTNVGYNRRVVVRGKVTDQPIATDSSVSMMWEIGQALVMESEMKHCNYDQTICYKARTVPVIHDISMSEGYTTGGQRLVIKGNGFQVDSMDSIDIKLDGEVSCKVVEMENDRVVCLTQAAASNSTIGPKVGQQGINWKFINGTGGMNYKNLYDLVGVKTLATQLEAPYYIGNYIGNFYQGWFEAPETTNYRFYQSCDDHCYLKFGKTPNNETDLELLIDNNRWQNWRNYWQEIGGRNLSSDWLALTKGEKYFIEAGHYEGGGGDHFSTAVEIEKANTIDHHQAIKEIQEIGVTPSTLVFEKHKVVVTNPDDGSFFIVYRKFSNNTALSKSLSIKPDASAAGFQTAIKTVFQGYGFEITVQKEMFDENDVVTTNATLRKKNEYTVTLDRLIKDQTFELFMVLKSTNSTIEVKHPGEVQLSMPPISGKFRVKCVNEVGQPSYTRTFDNLATTSWIHFQLWINEDCAQMEEKVIVWRTDANNFYNNGFSYAIKFNGLSKAQGQYEIVPLEDGTEITQEGGTINNTARKIVEYGESLMFDPVPFEMLKTYHQKPQLIMNVNGQPAVCHKVDCDFSYLNPTEVVTEFTFDTTTKILTLTGTNLPNKTDVYQIWYAQTLCKIGEVASETTIECTLQAEPVCGSFKPELISMRGIIPNSETVVDQTVECSVSSTYPLQDLNVLGGDNITFTGTNFPLDLQLSEVSINFNNPQKTICVPQSSRYDSLVCLTDPFDKNSELASTFGFQMTINKLGASILQDIVIKTDNKQGLSMIPSSVSPVLKTEIVFTVDSDFPHDLLSKDEFSVNITSKSAPEYVKRMNVVSVNNTDKTFKTKFGGALSGTYSVSIRHKLFGLIDTQDLELVVESKTSNIVPLVGSIYGGTLLTITGSNFGTEKTDNPVQISYNGGLGSTNCFVQETSASQIKCRIDPTVTKENEKTGKVIVFLKTYEESNCTMAAGDCQFSFTDNLPEVTEVITQFNAVDNHYEVKITGTAFTGTSTATEFIIGGRQQTILTQTETELVAKISNITGSSFAGAELYFDVGVAKGDSLVKAPMNLEPKLVSISPNSGYLGGTLITANVQGVGSSTKNLELVNPAGVSICKKLTIVDYGKVECLTTDEEIAAATAISVKIDSTTTLCGNSDTTQCQYQQLSTDPHPTISAVSKASATELDLTGTNFESTGFEHEVTLGGIISTSITVVDATSIKATFEKGVPVHAEAQTPTLQFKKIADGQIFLAKVSATLANPVLVTQSSTPVSCSYAGECLYSIQAEGLASNMKSASANAYVEVCGQKCVFSDEDSTESEAKCKLPKMSTTYSNANFGIESEDQDLNSGKHFGTNDKASMAFDGNNGNSAEDSSANCHVGMEFREGFVGMISQVKFFMANILDKSIFAENLKFEGSSDGATYETLFTVDKKIHEGWNYHSWPEAAQYPTFRYYRFAGTTAGSCRINEIKFRGVETIKSTDPDHNCEAQLFVGGAATSLNAQVSYLAANTGVLTSISPRHGSVLGGTVVTFTGEDFTATQEDVKVVIDGINCPVTESSATSIKCTTGSRPGLKKSTLSIEIAGKGAVSTKDRLFTYVNLWSEETTWGGEFAPIDGDSVYLPAGLNLLVDVDNSAQLKAVIVEGQLIFAPEADPLHERFFDAMYIFVRNGSMEVGTEENPYTSQLTITLHGNVSDPYIPIYGNKVIGVRHGTLDMHGVERDPVWTVMETTSNANESTITLARAVDWKAGERIGIATSSFEAHESEERVISSIDRTDPEKPVLTLETPLTYTHYSAIEDHGPNKVDLRCEVGLMTRNVKLRGDPLTSRKNQYGANIFMHSPGDDSVIGRLSHIELYQVGQAFKVGRYAIHFHMIGAVHQSYAKGVVIHESFNRAFTIHGTHHLRLDNNFVYHTMGHNFFIEDAIETKNIITNNLVMRTTRSWSLLNTDQTPASFWITHPDNEFSGNHAAGSDRYGYWYDLQEHAMGPSANMNICSENDIVGNFYNNSAHSNGRYGLRIFHNMIPRKYPCEPIVYDKDMPDDPYHKNPILTANFRELTSWKNKRNGAIALNVGDVRFTDFKVANNLLAGIEFEFTNNVGDDRTMVDGAVVVGMGLGPTDGLQHKSPFGIVGPKTEFFTVKNTQFFNYNFQNAAAFSDCSHCIHPAATDSGARTYKTSNLTFSNVTKRIRHRIPFTFIFHDLDGTLTNKGPGSWATFYYPHLLQPGCERENDLLNGIVCDNTVQVRRVAFHSAVKSSEFRGMSLKILKYDDDLIASVANKTEYIRNKTEYSSLTFKPKKDPSNAWVVPFITGHKYKVSWGDMGLNFESMKIQMSERFEPTDKPIVLVHNFTDVRVKIDVKVDGEIKHLNGTISETTNPQNEVLEAGMNVVYNDSDVRDMMEVHVVLSANGKDKYARREIQLIGTRCFGPCQAPPTEDGVEDEEERYWSQAGSWPNKTVPKDGEDVEIQKGWKMVLDIEETPIINKLEINGRLRFKNEDDPPASIHLRAKHIFVRVGELQVGNSTHPFERNATITLHGLVSDKAMVYQNAIEAGNKIIANVGNVTMFGKKRVNNLARLQKPAHKGNSTIFIDTGMDLVEGDRIALAPTSYAEFAAEDVIVQAYNATSGEVTLKSALDYYHWGNETSTKTKYGVDIRGEVVVLSRSITIQGDDTESWGGQFVTSTMLENDMTFNFGQTILDSVELYNMSQKDTHKSALRFEGASSPIKHSSITNCSIHNGFGWGMYVKSSENVHLEDNVLYSFQQTGIYIDGSNNVNLTKNIVIKIKERPSFNIQDGQLDFWAGISICSLYRMSTCKNIQVIENIVAGAQWAGFTAQAHACGDKNQRTFYNNVAHSVKMGKRAFGNGAIVYPDKKDPKQMNSGCSEVSDFFAYKNYDNGVTGIASTIGPTKSVWTRLTMIDNTGGFAPLMSSTMFGAEYNPIEVEVYGNKIYGESEIPDCPEGGGYCYDQIGKIGLKTCLVGLKGAAIHPIKMSKVPFHKMHESAWGGLFNFHDNSWFYFKKETALGQRNRALELFLAPDFYQPIYFENNKFVDVEMDALLYFPSPDPAWANLKDCSEWPCTGPKNILWKFKKTRFENRQGQVMNNLLGTEFQVISNNTGFAPYVSACNEHVGWNAFYCKQTGLSNTLAMLVFESLDDDREDRAMQPIYVSQSGTEQNNKLNAFMDHCWDGFYTCQKRLQRFPAVIDAVPGSVYNITYTGTPAKKQKYTLQSDNDKLGVTISIHYPGSESRLIQKDGKTIDYNQWNEAEKQYGAITQSACGENRFIGVKNILEFYLMAGCTLEILPRDAIQTSVRLEWNFASFFASGGTTKFVDRLAASLGINFAEIKIVSVYEGSLIIDYEIATVDPAVQASVQVLQTNLMATGQINLGAPLLDSAIAGAQIVTDGIVTAAGYTPVIITPTATNANTDLTTIDNGQTVITITDSSTLVNSLVITDNKNAENIAQNTMQSLAEAEKKINSNTNWELFNKIRLVQEEGKKKEKAKAAEQKEDPIEVVKRERQQRFAKEDKERAELSSKLLKAAKDKAKKKEEQTHNVIVYMLIGALAALVVGFVIYGLVQAFHKLTTNPNQNRIEKDQLKTKKYSKNVSESSFAEQELPQQFDIMKLQTSTSKMFEQGGMGVKGNLDDILDPGMSIMSEAMPGSSIDSILVAPKNNMRDLSKVKLGQIQEAGGRKGTLDSMEVIDEGDDEVLTER